jgi:predicted RNase H-like nuclease (RuvC/YqgF family)
VHVLTKILVVFCAVLSLLLAALSMAYATNADRIKASIDSERALRLMAEGTAKEQVTGYATEKANLAKQLQAMEAERASLNQDLSNLRAERTDLRSQVERSKADADAIRNQISQLGATADTQAALIKNYRDEVTQLRDELVKASKREIELVDRVNELTGQREVLEQNARALKEQLEETKLSLQSAQSGGTGLTGAAAVTEPREFTGPLVRASVTEVTSSPTGDLVVINEGSNRGLKDNTLMHVLRGNDFVASITLIRVEPGTSVGRITLTRKGMQVLKDDIVLSRLQ